MRAGAGAAEQYARCARLETEIGESLVRARQRPASFRGSLVDSLQFLAVSKKVTSVKKGRGGSMQDIKEGREAGLRVMDKSDYTLEFAAHPTEAVGVVCPLGLGEFTSDPNFVGGVEIESLNKTERLLTIGGAERSLEQFGKRRGFSSLLVCLPRQTVAHAPLRFLTEPEVPKTGEHHDHDADDVEDAHALPSFWSSHSSRHGPARPLDLGPIRNRP
jgi:hypothetical protein